MSFFTIQARCHHCGTALTLDIPPAAGRERLELIARLAYLRLFPAQYPCHCGCINRKDIASIVHWPDDPDSDSYFDDAVEIAPGDLLPEVESLERRVRLQLAEKYGSRKEQ